MTDSRISYAGSYFVIAVGGSLAFPLNYASDKEYMTVNFRIDGGGPEVPEPATMILFGTGLASLIGVRWRRKQK